MGTLQARQEVSTRQTASSNVPWLDGGARRFELWLAEVGIAEGRLTNIRALSGGTQNLLVRFTCGGRDLVLRRPALERDGGDKTIRREAAVLAALADTQVPHPHFRGLCEDQTILGGAFLITDEIPGFNAAIEMPGLAGSDPAFRHSMGIALVDGIAALSKIPIGRGLQRLGRSDGFAERQVQRWASQLAGYATLSGWSGPETLGPIAAIGQWLDANIPQNLQQGLMHGDYHIANVLFREADGSLAAILDWELAALGDPLLDLARLTTVWPDANNQGLLSLKVEPWSGFPQREELIARYALVTGRSMVGLTWFEVLACYKFGIVLEGTHARSQAGKADPAIGERLHVSAKGLIAKAARIVAVQ
jgi:aminoglycoside phosphotransferase (APT) family kinase protein